MPSPSAPGLLWLFARTAARRFCNRFLLGWQRSRAARRKKRGLPAAGPERTATSHRQQRFRAGTLLVVIFAAYMMFVMGMALELSLRKAMNRVRMDHAPAPALTQTERMVQETLGEGHAETRSLMRDDPLSSLPPETKHTARKVGGLFIALAGAGAFLFGLGAASRNMARPEPSQTWLFEFPVPRPVLFTARLGEALFDGATLPLLSMPPGILLFYDGHGFWASAGWGLLFGILLTLAVSALRLTAEIVMLQKLRRKRRGTLCGLGAAAGTLLMVMVLYGGGTPLLINTLINAADALPGWFFLQPLSAGFGSGTLTPGAQWLLAAGPVALLCAGSVALCAALTRYGLEPGLEATRTTSTADRNTPAAPAEKRPLFTGLIGKELLMLTRQRTVMVQVLIAPLIMVLVFYFQTGGRLAERALASDGAMASAIYGIAAYMVLIAAQVALSTELRTLWLLLSLPRPLADALRTKSLIWGLAAAVLALLLSVAAMVLQPAMASGLLLRLPFTLVLVWLIADLTVGFRTLGSCVISETTVQLRQWAAWLPLMLSAAAGQAIFSGDLWMLCVQTVLLGALNVSVWQQLNADLPYLTEPAEDPPPRLSLMHGQLAVYGYFVFQSLFIMLAAVAKLPLGFVLPAGSAAAALVVAGLALLSFKRRGLRILPAPERFTRQVLILPAAALLMACGTGWLWLKVAELIPSAAEALARSRSMLTASGGDSLRTGIAVLAIVIAPVCEEFLFRGIVYQGLRKSCGITASVLWSALFFTVVHPMMSAPAVFTAAIALALIMERTGRLLPCILVHAGYNAFMLWLQWSHS
jgi:ABC-2 type transport system permease protein